MKTEEFGALLVHDHVLLRQGLRRLLEDEADIESRSRSGNAAEALRTVSNTAPKSSSPTCIFSSVSPINREQLILRESPASKMLFLTADEGEDTKEQAQEGPDTHARRHTSASELVAMVRSTAAADVALRPGIHRKHPTEWPTEDLLPRQRVLTVRERQVLKLLAEGRTVRSAATILGLSVKTVDAHKFNLMRKLGIHNKAELVMWAIQKRVVSCR